MSRRRALAWLMMAGCSGSPAASSVAASEPAVADAAVAAAGEDDAAAAAGEDDAAADAKAREADETTAGPTIPRDDAWLADLLAAHPDRFGYLLADPARYRLEILVTVFAPEGDAPEGTPPVVEHGYRVDAEYTYPASAIKTFASVMALRTLADLQAQGHPVDLDTPMLTCRQRRKKPRDGGDGRKSSGGSKGPWRCQGGDESNLEGGVITIGHEIRKMHLVSDNIAFNRLYELVGHRALNEQWWALGLPDVRIQHRMYSDQDPEVQRTTPRVKLRPPKADEVVIEERYSDLPLPPLPFDDITLGHAYIDDETGERVDEPLDMVHKNYASVRDMHRLTLALARPGLPGVPDLGLRDEHRAFLLAAMTEDPEASTNPVYTDPHHTGLRYKTMIQGMMRVMPRPRLRYVNKPGRAYGFHVENAYIEDRETGWAMAVTTTLYANANGVINDNKYEYDGVTRPYLKDLGEVLARAVFLREPVPASAAAGGASKSKSRSQSQ